MVAFYDVIFCLLVREADFHNLFMPYAVLIHPESKSRSDDDRPEKYRRFQNEVASMKSRWGDDLLNDPHYNPTPPWI